MLTLCYCVYGDIRLRGLVIARDATVNDLRHRISWDVRGYGESKPRVYLARDPLTGRWLQGDEAWSLCIRNRTSSFKEMPSTWKLQDFDCFDEDFKSRSREVHILVEGKNDKGRWLTSRDNVVSVAHDERDHQYTEVYRITAERLKFTPIVNQLVNAVDRVKTLDSVPFIALESSQGVGKTQMAFNLMARSDTDVFYVVCELKDGDPMDSAFSTRSASFKRCLVRDCVNEVHEDIAQHDTLFTYGFIWAMLTDQSSFTGPHSRAQVVDAVQTRTKRCVFFLDEFMFAHGVDMPMERMRRQFMVDVFRSFGLPVIISSVDATERAGEYQRYTDSGVVCMVFPTFPRVRDPRIDNLPEEFRVVIENSRPLFANLALKYLDEHPFGATNGPLFVEFMDAMTGELAQQFTEHKHQFFIRFWTYQFMLFLAASYVRGACPHSMRLHFGQMAESSSFELCSQRFDSFTRQGNRQSQVGDEARRSRRWIGMCSCAFAYWEESISEGCPMNLAVILARSLLQLIRRGSCNEDSSSDIALEVRMINSRA